jgi:hypothetical protein
MRAAISHEPHRVEAGDRPDASPRDPKDAVVRVARAETINPGRVLDCETDLEGIADAYTAMDERRAVKSLVRVGSL